MRVRTIWRRGWAVGLLLASLTGNVPALAQDKRVPGASAAAQGAPSAADRDKAAQLYEEGAAAARAKELDKARGLLLASFELDPTFRTALNLAIVELNMGRPRDAAERLTSALRTARG